MEMRQRSSTHPKAPLNGGSDDNVRLLLSSNNGRRRRPLAKREYKGEQPILSTTAVICIVALCLTGGFLQHHYQVSRARDPMSLLGGLPMPKFVRDMQQRQQQQQQQAEKQPLVRKGAGASAAGAGGASSGAVSSLHLSAEADAQLERDPDGIRYHLIFSTDCSPYQHWQSYLVYFSALLVRQPGHVTRIASGCNATESVAMQQWFDQHIAHMSTSQRFHLQLTPHFSSVTNEQGQTTGDYKFFNKPFGLKYWMEHSPQLQYANGAFPASVQEDIVILIDPDMGLLRPITRDFTSNANTVITSARLKRLVTRTVGPGKPAAQVYGFGTQWAKLNLTQITGTPHSPALKVSREDGQLYYPVGPPYLATTADMYQIATKWTQFVPAVHAQYPHLLAEMFAFCIAAAHLQLPHQLISSLMVSDVGTGMDEGWSLVDDIPHQDVCAAARQLVDRPTPNATVPNVVHMCQRYGLGSDWFFSKRAIPADSVYDCQAPLFQEPPDNVATLYDYKNLPPGYQRKDVSSKEARRMGFMLCYLYRLLNEAATFYKANACAGDPTTNLEKTRNLVEYMKAKKKVPKKEVKE